MKLCIKCKKKEARPKRFLCADCFYTQKYLYTTSKPLQYRKSHIRENDPMWDDVVRAYEGYFD